jgi:hypothetical protein
MAPPSINTQVDIDADNKWIPLVIDLAPPGGAVDFTTSIPEGTYDDMPAVCAACQVAIRAVGGGAIIPNATCSVIFTGSVPGMIRYDYSADLGAGDTVEMDWFNNAHGENNADDHIGTVQGFDDSADDGPIGSPWYFTSDYQHQNGWYATRAIRSYGPFAPNAIGGDLRKVLARTSAKKLHVGFEWRYEIRLEQIPPWNMLFASATGTNLNRDLMSQWAQMSAGECFRWREDQEIAGTYFDLYLDSPHEMFGNLTRTYPDYEAYNLTMQCTLKE